MSIAQTINNNLSLGLIRDVALSWATGVGKTIKDTAKVAAPVLTQTGHTKLLGLGIKLGGLGLAAASGLSLAKNAYNATRNLAGSPSYDTATGDGIKGAIDIFTGASAAGFAFGKLGAVPALTGLATSFAFDQYEKLADGTSKIYDVPVLKNLLINQDTDGSIAATGTPVLRPSYDWAIKSDNWLRSKLGFADHKLRQTDSDKYNQYQEFITQNSNGGNLGVI